MTYDPRYLAGVLLFNDGCFFEAHEVWEDVWSESHGDERRLVQGLIQAAVGLCHFENGNLGGAVKLYTSSRDYLVSAGGRVMGLDIDGFLPKMERAFRPLLGVKPAARDTRPDPDALPTIELSPAPDEWPDPDAYVHEDE